ncbi:transposase [Actinoallomurus sp. NBC_01490]|uniref:IS110 family transposase n=1 Tax=Actinoallomurus sp. NBC_01490 TaxID=2903557 RepID=UPI002E3151F1|nr:transposase [Actinoallomurus sp. NBC_01490]
MQQVWAGVDIGKAHHHAVVIDAEGRRLLSRRVANDEPVLRELIAEVPVSADEVTWAIDVRSGGAALLVTLLLTDGQKVFYLSGHMVNRAADGYRGEGKTDARDAAIIITDQARMRRDLRPVLGEDELIALAHKGPLILLTGANTPAAVRGLAPEELTSWPRHNGVRNGAAALADRVIRAAQSQTVVLPGERMAARLAAELAKHTLTLTEQIEHTETLIEDRFARHELAEVITSMPGIGTLLGAEFLAATGGNMTVFASADHLAGYAGLAPRPRDSGRISGNRHRPRRHNRDLNRVFYTSALISVRYNPESRTYYDRKRAEGKLHTQAVLALARRRVNVLWALIRDRRCYELTPPARQAA